MKNETEANGRRECCYVNPMMARSKNVLASAKGIPYLLALGVLLLIVLGGLPTSKPSSIKVKPASALKMDHLDPQHSSFLAEYTSRAQVYGSRDGNVSIPYSCPVSVGKASNDKNFIFDDYLNDTLYHSKLFMTNNVSVSTLLDMEYGAWRITPRQRKALNARWIHWYGDALLQSLASGKNSNNSTTIYESACGVGLTLYVILELLQEHYNITGLEVYGNEYIFDNVISVNRFFDLLQQQGSESKNKRLVGVRKGRFCHGDSTNLSFVPSNSFDVVFTGYIDPIVDPLNLQWSKRQRRKRCHEKDGSYYQQLLAKEQGIVEDWFASWTGEMVRIAKPGGTVIIESISLPRCHGGSWGGVTKDWWTSTAISKYAWGKNINADSIELMDFNPDDGTAHIRNRYNVKLVKLKV